MKIRNDFVTNSSSTSFIFGSFGKSDESVETIYRLIRMIVFELDYISTQIQNEIYQIDEYKKYKYLDINMPNYYTLYQAFKKDLFIENIFKKYIDESIFMTIPFIQTEHGYFLFLACLQAYMYELNDYYKAVLNADNYDKYFNCANYVISIDDILSENEVDALEYYIDLFGREYLSRNNITRYKDSYELSENVLDKKSFLLNNLGSVVITYDYEYFSDMFDHILKYFSNYSD